jgi:hypothetical protein
MVLFEFAIAARAFDWLIQHSTAGPSACACVDTPQDGG